MAKVKINGEKIIYDSRRESGISQLHFSYYEFNHLVVCLLFIFLLRALKLSSAFLSFAYIDDSDSFCFISNHIYAYAKLHKCIEH